MRRAKSVVFARLSPPAAAGTSLSLGRALVATQSTVTKKYYSDIAGESRNVTESLAQIAQASFASLMSVGKQLLDLVMFYRAPRALAVGAEDRRR